MAWTQAYWQGNMKSFEEKTRARSENEYGLTAIFFVFMFVLGMFCIVFEPGFGSRIYGAAELFFDLILLTAFLMVVGRLSKGLASFLRISLYVILYAVAIIDVACYVRLQSPITPIWVEATMLTNNQEATEAFMSFVTPDLFFSKVGIVLLLLVLNIVAVCKRKKVDNAINILHHALPSKIRIISLCVIGVLLVADGALLWEEKEYFIYKTLLQYDELKVQERKDLTPKARNYIPVYRLAYSLSEYSLMQSARKELWNSADKVVVDSCSFSSPHIVLIVGESCNRSHSSLYGYDKPTAPFQQQMAEKGELVRFNNVVSSWNVTAESFQYMFSLYGAGDPGRWYEYPLITQFLKKAGYDNLFLSNQYVLAKANSISEYKEDVFVNSRRISETQFNRRNSERHEFDEGLIDDYDMLFNPESEHTFTIVHFQGLHFEFIDRYPESRTVFTESDYSRPDLNDEKKGVLAAYDNAMRYNDSVISSVIDRLRDSECITIFVPDHGERIFDNCTEWGRSLTWDSNDIRQQFEIPFWIWASADYKERHPDVWTRVESAADRKFMTDNLPHLILDLAGISTPYYKSQNDLLSPDYNEERPRILRDERDYDEICDL